MCAHFEKISQTLRKRWEKLVTLEKITYAQKNELHLIKWVGNESNYLKWVTLVQKGHVYKKVVGLIKMSQI